jgi:hypothetical protein
MEMEMEERANSPEQCFWGMILRRERGGEGTFVGEDGAGRREKGVS